MAIIVDFIREYAPWAYGACALVALWHLRLVLLARRERRYAVFTLEREAALNRVYGGWGVAFALALVMGGVYFLSTVVSDAVQPLIEEGRPNTTPTVLLAMGTTTTTPTLPVSEITPTGTATTRARPTARPQPTAVAAVTEIAPADTPAPPAVERPRCPDGRAVISAPGMGAQVSGMVAVTGRAVHETFQFYKLEYGAGADPSVWSYFDGGDRPVDNGQLGALNTGALPPGVYSIRIVVVDAGGNYPPPCQTTIVIP